MTGPSDGLTRILRYEIPVDGEWHDFSLGSYPLYLNSPRHDLVEFWAFNYGNGVLNSMYRFKVFGTGHTIPRADMTYHGTAIWSENSSRLVRHLLEESRGRLV